MPYTKNSPRINVKFIDADTEEQIFEIKNRNWTDIGQLFTDYIATELIESDCKTKNKPLPKNVMVIAVGEYTRT
jgi:hypothetical protein